MAVWYYVEGKNALGHPVQGRYAADSEWLLMTSLNNIGVTPISVKKIGFFQACWVRCIHRLCWLLPIPRVYLSIFYDQLAHMLGMGMSVKTALLVMAHHFSHPRFVRVLHRMIDDLNKGYALSHAMRQHQHVFPPEVVKLMELTRSTDALIAVLRYCDQAAQRFFLFQKILYMLIPQLAVTAVLFACLMFMRVFYLEGFHYAIFVFGNPEPNAIRFFRLLTDFFTTHVTWNLGIVILIIFSVRFLLKRVSYCRYLYDVILLWVPVLRGVLFAIERERLALLYAVLCKGGLPLQTCTQYAGDVVVNRCFRKKVNAMAAVLRQGESFSALLKRWSIFSPADIQLLSLSLVSRRIEHGFERVYSLARLVLEKKLVLLTEFLRITMYAVNVSLFLFSAYILQLLFFYPGPTS